MNGEIFRTETVHILRLKRTSSSRQSCDIYFQTLMQQTSGTYDRWLIKDISGSELGDLDICPSLSIM